MDVYNIIMYIHVIRTHACVNAYHFRFPIKLDILVKSETPASNVCPMFAMKVPL